MTRTLQLRFREFGAPIIYIIHVPLLTYNIDYLLWGVILLFCFLLFYYFCYLLLTIKLLIIICLFISMMWTCVRWNDCFHFLGIASKTMLASSLWIYWQTTETFSLPLPSTDNILDPKTRLALFGHDLHPAKDVDGRRIITINRTWHSRGQETPSR